MRPYGAFFSGDFDRLQSLMNETVEACRTHGRTWELAFALQLRAKVNNDVTERLADSIRDIGESRRLFERLGDEWGTAETLSAEAEAAIHSGEWLRAVECCREGIALARKIGSHQHVPVLTVRMGDALISAGDWEQGERLLREGIEDAQRFGSASDGAAFFGNVLLAGALSHRHDTAQALEVIEETIRQNEAGGTGMPGFISGMLLGMKGSLLGKSGRPVEGLRLLTEGVEELARHPLANVITPRLSIMLTPAAAQLLRLVAEADGGPEHRLFGRRVHRSVVLLGAHQRWRPSVVPPAELRELEEEKALLRDLLGEQAYEAGYAEGDGLQAEEAVALMRDVE